MKFNVELSESIFFLKNCVEFLESKKKKKPTKKQKPQNKEKTEPKNLLLTDLSIYAL